MVALIRSDLDFILTQIELAESGQDPVNPHLAFGLRTVDGSNNSLVAGQSTYGAADQIEPRVTNPVFQNAESMPAGFFGPGSPGGPGASYASTSGYVFDSQPRVISNLIADQTANNPAAVQAAQAAQAQLGDGYLHSITTAGPDGILGNADDITTVSNTSTPTEVAPDGSLFINNVTPDAGLSAPYNTLFTLFGQFFDHGIDSTTKGGNGTIFIPLQPDDPLYKKGGSANFMVLTRATNQAGADGVLGTVDDIHTNTNTDTPFVDQSQTYSSHPSHQVFLREYIIGSDHAIHSTGRMLSGANGGEPTWADVKANALKLGIQLNDTQDVTNIPLLKVDAYGNFIPDPVTGLAQIVVGLGADGVPGTDDDVLAHGTKDSDGTIHAITTNGALRIGVAFINDMANSANPVDSQPPHNFLIADTDGIVNDAAHPVEAGHFDVDLLNQHYVAGDGRINENIGLTAIHEVFHNEHNNLVQQIKDLVTAGLAAGDTALATDWTLPGADLTDGIADNEWNGERLFQAARFGNETQYQHLVFEEFARKVSPAIHAFGNVNIHLDPAITEEFANAVYRFGHSMLDENLNRYVVQGKYLDANGQATDDATTGILNPLAGTPVLDASGHPVLNSIGLVAAFTNPLEFASQGTSAAGQLLTGTAGQIGNEIDEFVTGTLRNSLLGLPLDLAAINIARGRDVGIAPLNVLRNQIYSQTQDGSVKPYTSWADFGQNLKHELSLINFVAAYGDYASVLGATTVVAKRAAALDVVTLGMNAANKTAAIGTHERDAYDFMHSLGAYANIADPLALAANPYALHNADGTLAYWSTGNITGLDHVDLWIGGLAEKQNLFGGLLGSTFDFIFRSQLESLQDSDRFYYLTRLEGTHLLGEIENNSFAEMIMHDTGVKHLSASAFLTPEYTVEASTVNPDDQSTWAKNPATGKILIDASWVLNADGTHAHGSDGADIKSVHFLGDDNFLGNTIVLGGTAHDDYLIAGAADDDTVYGDGGNDHIDGGVGDDFLYGGAGDDIINDEAGNDTIHGDAGNDTIFAGIGDDIVFGGDGNDVIDGGKGLDDIQGGLGNDIIRGGEGDDEIQGNEGADWIEGGQGGDVLVGDVGAPTGQIPLYGGDDVIIGGTWVAKDAQGHPVPNAANMVDNNGGDRMQGFSGDDIMVGGGGFNKFDGRKGYDWASLEFDSQGVEVDMNKKDFIIAGVPASADAIRDVFIEVEGISGSSYGDHLIGTNDSLADPDNELTNINLIQNLDTFFSPGAPVHYNNGNIMLGGGGSDVIQGGGGDDIIDGDAYLHVSLRNGQIVREILNGGAKGDVDTAVYSDVAANYSIGHAVNGRGWEGLDGEGFFSVVHVTVGAGATDDGVDKVRNIERLQFADGLHTVNEFVPIKSANQLPFGTVDIAGNPVVGQTLTASASLFDLDVKPSGAPVTNATYQWEYLDPARGEWIPITGATGTTYKVASFVVGQPIRVEVAFVDALGYTEHVLAAQTAVVTPAPNVNTRPFVVPQQGQIGLPDTNVLDLSPVNLFLPVTKVFGDAETLPAALIYTVTLANGAALSTVGLSVVNTVATNGAIQITGTLNAGVTGPLDIKVTATDSGPGTPLTVTDTFTLTVVHASSGSVVTVNGTLQDGYIAGATVFMDTNDDGNRQSFEAQTTTDATGHFALSGKPGTLIAFGGPGAIDVATGLPFTDVYKAPVGSLVISPLTTILVKLMELGNVGLDSAQDTLRGALGLSNTVSITQLDPIALMHSTDQATKDLGTHLFSISAEILNTVAMIHAAVPNADPMSDILDLISHGLPFDLSDPATIASLVASAGMFGAFAVDTVKVIVDSNALLLHQADGNPPADQILTGITAVSTVAQGVASAALFAAFEQSDLDSVAAHFTGQALAQLVEMAKHHVGDVNGDGVADNDGVATGAVIIGTAFDDVISPTQNLLGQTLATDHNDIILGLAGNDQLDGGLGADILVGGSGDDTYFVDNAGDAVDEIGDDVGIDSVVSSVSFDLSDAAHVGGKVENLTLTGTADLSGTGNALDNVLVGNSGANILQGGDGNDTLDGGAGADQMTGGLGNDTFKVDNFNDVVHEAVGGGTDTILASVSYTLGAGEEIEILQANAAGTTGITLTGNALANTLISGAGIDTLIGGLGNDTYQVNNTTDVVKEGVGGGSDTVLASVSYTLGAGEEIEILQANAGSTGITLTGNALANTLISGAGNDVLAGGLGNDIYQVNNVGDIVHEAIGGGTDTVLASVSYTLGAGEEIEKLTLTGAANIDATGNALNNTITGNAGNNILRGGLGADTLDGGSGNDTLDGGAGVDQMTGGLGNDTFYVDNLADGVHEAVGGGTDTVLASVSYTLGAGEEIEILQANAAGTTGITLTGNALANTLISGAGLDTLTGGLGNDTYQVNNFNDVVHEASGGGTDTVLASVSYTLGAGEEIETLRANAGALGITLTGNALANTLISGAGNDILFGGLGNDTYQVNSVGDVVREAVGGGTDTVLASANFTLLAGQEIENLTANAGLLGLALTGNELANTLTSGAGNDTLTGGAGNDTFIVNNVGDAVHEAISGGTDTVFASSNFTLQAGQEIEILRANAGATGLVLTGNEFANTLISGTGNDTLAGGGGNDTYQINNTGDVVIEGVGQGTDTVQTSVVTYTLANNVENLTFASGSNAFNFHWTGNAANNTITGGNGNDTFEATIGDGNDTYNGGTGLNTYSLASTSAAATVDLFLGVSSSAQTGLDKLAGIQSIIGGSGNDSLVGSHTTFTADTFTGGGGADTFVFNALSSLSTGAGARDKFVDFSQAGGDRIDLRAVDINPAAAGTQHYTFNPATAAFSGTGTEFGANTQGQIRYHYETVAGAEHTILDLHASNAVGGPDGQIDLGVGHLTIHATDLLLA